MKIRLPLSPRTIQNLIEYQLLRKELFDFDGDFEHCINEALIHATQTMFRAKASKKKFCDVERTTERTDN